MSGLQLKLNCDGDNHFLLSLNCAIPVTGITAIYGPSGCGKSTLLDCIAGLRTAQQGSSIQLDDTVWLGSGTHAPAWERSIGYVFQDARLFPHLSVQENLLYAMKRSSSTAIFSLHNVTQLLGLSELLARSPETLSAGQMQRVAIGRALMSSPQLLLLDEPFANLDHAARQQCMDCLQQLAQQTKLPMLYVSHDIEEVTQLADHIVLMEHGMIADQGPLLELCSRLDTRLSQEEQAAALLTASVARHDIAYGLSEILVEEQTLYVSQLTQLPGQKCRIKIPARDVSVCRQRPVQSSILNIMRVTVDEIEQTEAPRLLLRLALGSQFLLARITRKSLDDLNIKLGDTLYAQIKSAALLMDTWTT